MVKSAQESVERTMREFAEEEITKIHRETETVLNRISDSIISVDNNWRYTFLNDAATRFLVCTNDFIPRLKVREWDYLW